MRFKIQGINKPSPASSEAGDANQFFSRIDTQKRKKKSFSLFLYYNQIIMNIITPPLHRGMIELERSVFKKVINTLAIKVPVKQVGLAKKSFAECVFVFIPK